MSGGNWAKAKSTFEDVVDRPESEWSAALSSLCGQDDALRTSVEALLAAHREAGEFLERDATVSLGSLLETARAPAEAPPDVGQNVGPYRLVERLGEGGFGIVYRAEQQRPVRRDVALKIIKPGMDSRAVIARFEMERQALARMDHPNIARVLDAGETPDGRPYFAMELVRGEPITRYCHARRADLRESLGLFTIACRAVQHAHQKGVVHRDLKPSNVIVVEDGAQPKIIDFGIAKAIGEPLSDTAHMTSAWQVIGTPAYMSPEQTEPGATDIDTRADVYSLGVVLYEILTGVTPFDVGVLNRSGLAVFQRLIREADPPAPSARLAEEGTDGPGHAGTKGNEKDAEATRSNALSLRGSVSGCFRAADLRGDLDQIVMKCLSKDRDQRYASAAELAADIQRFLNDEPIAAGPPSAAYRLRKFARRNRTGIIAGVCILAALLLGFGAAVAGYMEAERARVAAETQRTRAEASAAEARDSAASAAAVTHFLEEMLASADPRASSRSDVTVQAALDDAVRKLDGRQLAAQPKVEAAVRGTIGRAYRELAMYPAAEKQLSAAVELTTQAFGPNSWQTALALQQRGALWKYKGDFPAAERDLRAAMDIGQAHRGTHEADFASMLSDLATVLQDQKRYDESVPLLEEATRIVERPEHDDQPAVAEVRNNAAFLHVVRQDWEAAEESYRAALDWNRRHRGESHPDVATNLDNLAQVLVARKNLADAEQAYRQALAIRRNALPPDHPEVATTLHNLGTLLNIKGDPPAAEQLVRESLAIFRRVYGPANESSLVVMHSLVSLFAQRGALPEAEQLMRETYDSIRDASTVSDASKRALASRLAALCNALHRSEDAALWESRAQPPATTSQP